MMLTGIASEYVFNRFVVLGRESSIQWAFFTMAAHPG